MKYVAISILLLLAGCTSSPSENESYEDPSKWEAGYYVIENQRVLKETHFSISGDGARTTINHLQPFAQNSAQMWAILALEDLDYEYSMEYELHFNAGQSEGGENPQPYNPCIGEFILQDSAAQWVVNKARGQSALMPVVPFHSGSKSASLGGGGEKSGSSSGTGNMAEGQWKILGTGMSQFNPNHLESGTHATEWISNGAYAVVYLPPTPFICDYTFHAASEGADYQSIPLGLDTQFGGRLQLNLPYGGQMEACNFMGGSSNNQATLQFGQATMDFRDGGTFSESSLTPTTASVQVEQWTGTPILNIFGLPPQVMTFADFFGC